jgi:hypothetical protein
MSRYRTALGSAGVATTIGGLLLAACESSPTPGVMPAAHPRGTANGVVYTRSAFLRGLGAEVVITKGPGYAYGTLPDGSRIGLAALRRADIEAQRAKTARIEPGFFATLQRSRPDARITAMVYFRPQVDWRDIAPRLFGQNGPNVAEARAELQDAIAVTGESLASEIRQAGGAVLRLGRRLPGLHIETTVDRLRTLGHDDRVQLVTDAEPAEPQWRCNGGADKRLEGCDADPSVFHITEGYNGLGHFGAPGGIRSRVGMLEDAGNCIVESNHEAFEYIGGFFYSNSSPESCINTHATAVASVFSGSNDGDRCGASDVEFYYANDGLFTQFPEQTSGEFTSICHAAATLNAYDWFASVGDPGDPFVDPPLAVVNESYGCMRETINCDYAWAAGREGITQDYFARIYDLVITKSSGNDNCSATQEACPWTLNSICVGSVTSDEEIACKSSTANPGTESGLGESDREEPDVVGLGGESDSCAASANTVCVADASDPGAWIGTVGTSFSAPAIGAIVTLFREQCESDLGYRLSQRFIRATVRNAAFDNIDGPAYSTPKPTTDHLDGGGLLRAVACADGETSGGGSVLIDLDSGGDEDMPEGDSLYQDEWTTPGETQGFYQPLATDYEPGGSDRHWQVLEEWSLSEDERIRATWSWDGCTLSDQGTAPATVAVDFDLFLYSPQFGYLWASQSLDDSNEGFDYTVQPGEDGDYQLILAWPTSSVSCEGINLEPGALAWHRL